MPEVTPKAAQLRTKIRAQRFSVFVSPLDRLASLVRGELRLAPELHALGLRIGAPALFAFAGCFVRGAACAGAFQNSSCD